jgi:hypothetical protein
LAVGKISLLIIDILLFAFNTGRQLILPGKGKKGNLLSSLFIFFTGLIERLGSFEYGIFRMANVLKQKYVKQSLLIVATLLFLLSSFEWTGEKKLYNNSSSYTAQLSDAGVKEIATCNCHKTTSYSNTSFVAKIYSPFNSVCQTNSTATSSLKKFLLIRNMRI